MCSSSKDHIMAISTSPSSSLLHLRLLLGSMLCPLLFMEMATALTDPAEASALNTIFQTWGISSSSSWNTTGDPCTGAALDATYFGLDQYNPIITCDCTNSTNGTTCHITQLKVYALDVTGPIPQELQVLTRLRNLNLAQNYLTGPVPAFFGNFTEMLHMSFGVNALSGPIPKELGNLKNLILLGMGANNFNGTIPREFGGMTNLEEWYMDSSGLSGELPSELSNLTKIKKLWASDNNLAGKLPDFIGSLTNLTELMLQGNSFQGPIPASFSNLTQMTKLRIGEIINGSSTLQFINSMPSLSTLILRNCKISGALPSNFSRYSSLQHLDLSFNNITGSIPQSLFSLSSLKFLFLGNNSLSGSLPAQKSSPLNSVSFYNQLAGSFPSWISQPNLQVNLIANNFVIDSSNSSTLLAGLNCLQRDIPCYRNSPLYSEFAVKCGGSKAIKASDGFQYEIDDVNLTSASYYVTDPIKWGVSSVGIFMESSNSDSYKLNNLNQFQNTLDPELFQTSRLSPSSLRYYGLGLENGNYSVRLQFAETQFVDGTKWQSVGRRIFDIYIQGDLKEKDFDIRKEAGDVSFKAVVKEYTAPVTNNFLEIHFFWAGKGTCCVPYQGYYGPSISAISVSPKDFTPTVSNNLPGSSSSNHTGLAVGLGVGAAVIALTILCLILRRIRRKRILKEEYERVLQGMDVKPDIFSYSEMKIATDDFSSSNELGEGGYGPVFKGKLPDGRIIAVKQLSVTSDQGMQQFLTEIATISAVRHRNLVKLHGCCVEGDKQILVYEFLENKSLDQAIFGKSKLHLDWSQRFDICLGVARGLAYLHEESSLRIVHRDVKASNVLLDADLNPKISDFGLAKPYDEDKTHVSTQVVGTIGYLAPEYAMRGHLTEKADVYAFGVLSLEILAGRPKSDQSLDTEKIYLLDWAWYLHENKRELELVDGSLSSFNKDEVVRVIGVALLCTQLSPAQRPSMSRVVAMLAGDVAVGEVTMKPSYLADWQHYKDVSSTYVAVDTSSSTELPANTQRTNSAGAGTSWSIMSTPLSVGRRFFNWILRNCILMEPSAEH